MLYLHENGSYYFLVQVSAQGGTGIDYDVCALDALPELTWTRLTGTFDGSWLRCYVDGALHSEKAYAGIIDDPVGEVVIGKNYPGDVDALRVFERALSAAEIAEPWP